MSTSNRPTTPKANTPAVDVYEDDLVTWLQYPTDDAFERSYCSDVFQGGWQLAPDARISSHSCGSANEHVKEVTSPSLQVNLPAFTSLAVNHMGSKPTSIQRSLSNPSADEALAQGAARAAGYITQVGQDAYGKVRTIMQPAHACPLSNASSSFLNSGKGYKHHVSKLDLPLSSVPPCPPGSFQNAKSIKRAMVDSPSSSTAKNSTSLLSTPSKKARRDLEAQSKTHRTETSRITEGGVANRGKMVGMHKEMPLSCSTISQTSMHLSRMEMEYSERHKQDDSDIFSDDYTNDESIDMRKCVKPSSRRNRVAEVHNLSERNRRNRINEKLKALQDLIPNSTKTDKASVLDEAIEYMKTLQMQLQMVSMRNSVNVTTVMMPMSVPQAHLQMAHPHSIGLGVPIAHPAGMGMSFGAGIEIGAAGPTALLQYPVAMNQHGFQSGSYGGFAHMGFPQTTQVSPSMQSTQELQPYDLTSQGLPYMHQLQHQDRRQPFPQNQKHEQTSDKED